MTGTGTIVLGSLTFYPNPQGIGRAARAHIAEIPIVNRIGGIIQWLGTRAERFGVNGVFIASNNSGPNELAISDCARYLNSMYQAGNEIEFSASEDITGRMWYYRGVLLEGFSINEVARSPNMVAFRASLVVSTTGDL